MTSPSLSLEESAYLTSISLPLPPLNRPLNRTFSTNSTQTSPIPLHIIEHGSEERRTGRESATDPQPEECRSEDEKQPLDSRLQSRDAEAAELEGPAVIRKGENASDIQNIQDLQDLQDSMPNVKLVENLRTECAALCRDTERISHRLSRSPNRIAPPPTEGPITLVFSDVESSTILWESLPSSVMMESVRILLQISRKLLLECQGYEVKTEGDGSFAAFSSPSLAITYALRLQIALLRAPWPPLLLTHPAASAGTHINTSCTTASSAITQSATTTNGDSVSLDIVRRCEEESSLQISSGDDSVRSETRHERTKAAVSDGELACGGDTATSPSDAIGDIADGQDLLPNEEGLFNRKNTLEDVSERNIEDTDALSSSECLWRGFRVRVGVHTCQPFAELDAYTGRMDYYGTGVNLAARVGAAAHGGQILVTSAAWKAATLLRTLSCPGDEGVPVGKRCGSLEGIDVPGMEGGVEVVDRGEHILRGVSDPVHLYEVTPTMLTGRKPSIPPLLRCATATPSALSFAPPRSTKGAPVTAEATPTEQPPSIPPPSRKQLEVTDGSSSNAVQLSTKLEVSMLTEDQIESTRHHRVDAPASASAPPQTTSLPAYIPPVPGITGDDERELASVASAVRAYLAGARVRHQLLFSEVKRLHRHLYTPRSPQLSPIQESPARDSDEGQQVMSSGVIETTRTGVGGKGTVLPEAKVENQCELGGEVVNDSTTESVSRSLPSAMSDPIDVRMSGKHSPSTVSSTERGERRQMQQRLRRFFEAVLDLSDRRSVESQFLDTDSDSQMRASSLNVDGREASNSGSKRTEQETGHAQVAEQGSRHCSFTSPNTGNFMTKRVSGRWAPKTMEDSTRTLNSELSTLFPDKYDGEKLQHHLHDVEGCVSFSGFRGSTTVHSPPMLGRKNRTVLSQKSSALLLSPHSGASNRRKKSRNASNRSFESDLDIPLPKGMGFSKSAPASPSLHRLSASPFSTKSPLKSPSLSRHAISCAATPNASPKQGGNPTRWLRCGSGTDVCRIDGIVGRNSWISSESGSDPSIENVAVSPLAKDARMETQMAKREEGMRKTMQGVRWCPKGSAKKSDGALRKKQGVNDVRLPPLQNL